MKAFHYKGMHGRQASDERRYLKVNDGGKRLNSIEYVKENTKGCLLHDILKQISAAWESKAAKDGKSVCRDVNDILDTYAVGMRICSEGMYDGDELVLGTWKDTWKHIKKLLVDHQRKERKETSLGKKMQSEI